MLRILLFLNIKKLIKKFYFISFDIINENEWAKYTKDLNKIVVEIIDVRWRKWEKYKKNCEIWKTE